MEEIDLNLDLYNRMKESIEKANLEKFQEPARVKFRDFIRSILVEEDLLFNRHPYQEDELINMCENIAIILRVNMHPREAIEKKKEKEKPRIQTL